MNAPTILQLVQGSPEWLAYRRTMRNASESAAVLGLSPWQTPYQLWLAKTGAGTHPAGAAWRPRRSQAGQINVFIHTSPFRKVPQYSNSTTVPLRRPTSDTPQLVRAAVRGLQAIYRPGFNYIKAGVMLSFATDIEYCVRTFGLSRVETTRAGCTLACSLLRCDLNSKALPVRHHGVSFMPLSNAQRSQCEALAYLAATQFNDEQAYTDLTTAALQICDGRIALISLHDGDKMWFRTRVGLEAREIPKEKSFCECAMDASDQILMVQDAAADPRFSGNPLVTGPLGIRFYVGAPMHLSTGQILGNLCVLDTEPKTLAPEKLELLGFLARQVAQMLEKSVSWVRPLRAA